jgi:ferredoxin-NADP reductase
VKFDTYIKDIIQRTHNVLSFRFPRPVFFDFKAGQFMFITVKIGDQKLIKPFTISSSPTEREYVEFTKKLTGHKFSNALKALKIGDWLSIDAPYGRFLLEEDNKICFLSGGIGITPFRSICKYCTDLGLKTDIVLIYGNRTEKDIVFKEDFEQMQRKNMFLRAIFTLDTPNNNWDGLSGRISHSMIKDEISNYRERIFYICGPPVMVKTIEKLLLNLKILKSRIRKENFSGY